MTAPRALAVAAASALLVAALVFDLPLCPLAALAGVPCPGCGLTRATLAMLSGDWHRAVQLHPLSPVALPLFAGLGFVALPTKSLTGATHRYLRAVAPVLAGIVLAAMIGVWAARFQGFFGGPVAVAGPIWSAASMKTGARVERARATSLVLGSLGRPDHDRRGSEEPQKYRRDRRAAASQ